MPQSFEAENKAFEKYELPTIVYTFSVTTPSRFSTGSTFQLATKKRVTRRNWIHSVPKSKPRGPHQAPLKPSSIECHEHRFLTPFPSQWILSYGDVRFAASHSLLELILTSLAFPRISTLLPLGQTSTVIFVINWRQQTSPYRTLNTCGILYATANRISIKKVSCLFIWVVCYRLYTDLCPLNSRGP
jgi:hypothetical protein